MAGYIKKNNEFIPLTGDGYGLPLGTIIAYEGSVPDGFLACDGSAYNTTTYSALYALLGVGTTPDLTSQKMTNTDGWCIKATPAYVEPDTVSDMVHTMRVQDSYSTEEVNTGKTWIDGKPIYRKVFSTTISGSLVQIDTSNLNIDKLLNAGYGYCVDTNNNMTSIPYNWNSQYYINIYYNISQQKICVNSSGYNGSTAVFAIEYTKTTD